MAPPEESRPAAGLPRPWLLALIAVVVCAYAPSLGGDFLNYDDRWLITQNPVLPMDFGAAMARIWCDFAAATRHSLGAEYLPIRDSLHWLEAHSIGLAPAPLRLINLALYVGAIMFLRDYLRHVLATVFAVECAALLFALHPVHVESVAWLAGRKDVLALFFATAALATYARATRVAIWLVPALVLLACFSKAVAIVLPLLFVVHDGWVKRRPPWLVTALSALAALVAVVVHVTVGAAVVMTTVPPGGSRLATAATMGPVWAGYLGKLLWPAELSIIYDVPARSAGDLGGWAGYAVLVAWSALGVAFARAGRRLPLLGLAWFVIPLLPTSQIATPLQNLMADRYLLLAALGPCLVVAGGLASVTAPPRARMLAVAGLAVALGATTAWRAWVMSDSVRLWRDTTAKSANPKAPYQLALALGEQEGREAEMETAFRTAIAREGGDAEVGRAARNNLATLLVRRGRLGEAEAILRAAVSRFPNDPKVLNNLAEVLARRGAHEEARRLYDRLRTRFPHYRTGQRNYLKRYGGQARPLP